MRFGRSPPKPPVEGEAHKVRAGETWSSLALKRYGDARLGKALAEVNGASPLERLELGKIIVLPAPDVLNREMNAVDEAAVSFWGAKPLHVLPTQRTAPQTEAAAAVDADFRARMARARAGMALHAKGGGWQPTSTNKPPPEKKKKRRLAPELEDRWLRRLSRLSPRGAMKVARDSEVGIGPTLSFLGGLREADSGPERMDLAQRFLQAYGSPAHTSMKGLLEAVAV